MANHQLKALVLNHVAFEDLGSLQVVLRERNFDLETLDASTAPFPLAQAALCDLLIVLGGPIGVGDTADYPFLTDELACIRQRMDARKPILGICLGAQLMAAALGARVYPGTQGPEIGWAPLQRPLDVETPEWFSPLLTPSLSLFHWHGDTFDLPEGSRHLASTNPYKNQAFALGDFALALQFHPEVTAAGLERWYVGHSCELRATGIGVRELRAEGLKHAPALEIAANIFWNQWLDYIL
jgi:GMP synthase (glutamine-hydrolysing)